MPGRSDLGPITIENKLYCWDTHCDKIQLQTQKTYHVCQSIQMVLLIWQSGLQSQSRLGPCQLIGTVPIQDTPTHYHPVQGVPSFPEGSPCFTRPGLNPQKAFSTWNISTAYATDREGQNHSFQSFIPMCFYQTTFMYPSWFCNMCWVFVQISPQENKYVQSAVSFPFTLLLVPGYHWDWVWTGTRVIGSLCLEAQILFI